MSAKKVLFTAFAGPVGRRAAEKKWDDAFLNHI